MNAIPKIPYFQTSRYKVATMVELANLKPGELVADLGTGDGRIAIAFAKKGATVTAYEIDDQLRSLAKQHAAKENITSIEFVDKDFWQEDLSKFNIICCYPMPGIMGRLGKKLQVELKPGARVLLNYFPFLHWKETATKDNVYLYKK